MTSTILSAFLGNCLSLSCNIRKKMKLKSQDTWEILVPPINLSISSYNESIICQS